ncbi:MAG: glutaredoxin 3 [Myxococcales bacterium]|nr:glutaredoxin 3 [Myxococcales bacterium]
MATVVIYTRAMCPFCWRATKLLDKKGVAYEERDCTGDNATRAWLVEATGQNTVPQVFINDRPVGGYDDIAALDRRGELDRLLAEPAPG